MNLEKERKKQGVGGGGGRIAIIGGGFTGAMLAVQLLRQEAGSVSIVLIERERLAGRGVAYGTQFDGHLLNVRASNMSAYPDAPDHFVRWAQLNCSPSIKPGDFLPRPLFGQYVMAQLQQAIAMHPGKLSCIQDEAISLARVGGASHIQLASGQTVVAEKVVLALGNFAPGDLWLAGKTANSTRYISNPWSGTASRDATGGAHENAVLLIGSGLTSVDMVTELRARGFEGTIHILSRHGLLPQGHKAAISFLPSWGRIFPRTVRELLRLIRAQIEAAKAQGSDWREVIDSLRPVTQEIWQNLPQMERRRFLRHVRTYWDVHRHRIAGRIADQLALQIKSGEIRMHAGRITEYCEDAVGVEISYRDRKSGHIASLRVDRVVNCTGPEGDFRRVDGPLLANLMGQKLVRPDELFLGLDACDDGALLDEQGRASDSLYTLGPLRKGNLWETIAVPEIRVQVAELAKLLLASYRRETSEAAMSAVGTEVSASLSTTSMEETCISNNFTSAV